MIILLTLLSITYEDRKYDNPDLISGVYLKPGKYIIHCHGAQGGAGFDDGTDQDNGGYGAYVSGTLTITGETQLFYAHIGGQGHSGPKGPNEGGKNGGGNSGKDEIDGNDASGGGGGASDLRYGNGMETRIIVAAGGSGGAATAPGATGGDLNGRFIGCIGPHENDFGCDSYPEFVSTETTQTKGNLKLGFGGDGKTSTTVSGSGGGGGWQGGIATGHTSGYWDHYNYSVAHSGSSYISGYEGCERNEKYVFEDCKMVKSYRKGDGQIRIATLYECNSKCGRCTSEYVCQECVSPYKLNGTTCLETCPSGTRDMGDRCIECEVKNCMNCPIENQCENCFNDFNFLTENGVLSCVKDCPDGKMALEGYCVDCNPSCRTCSSNVNMCDSCHDQSFLFDNKCYSDCSELNDESKKEFYGQDNDNKICSKCTVADCVDCSPDFNRCEKCSSLHSYDSEKNLCILTPTKSGHFTPSDKFTYSGQFSPSGRFIPSDKFTYSGQFSPSGQFIPSGKFTSSGQFTQSGQFIPSDKFTSSTQFSQSGQFLPSDKFTSSGQFSPSGQFLPSDKFTSSGLFTPSELFTQLPTFDPLNSSDLSCSAVFDEENITLYGRCIFDGSIHSNVYVFILRSEFSDFINESNGGAICISDCAIKFNNATFTNCVSLNGNGGAIYINNSIVSTDAIVLENLVFRECKSVCGGAVFIWAETDLSNVSIISCTFCRNQATGRNTGTSNPIYGGNAVFFSARNGLIVNSSFERNIGSTGGALKIYNIFNNDLSNLNLMNKHSNSNSISVADCYFESSKELGSFISYINGKDGSKIEVKDCKFRWKSNKKLGFIEGKEMIPENPKMHVVECIFEYDEKDIFAKARNNMKFVTFSALIMSMIAIIFLASYHSGCFVTYDSKNNQLIKDYFES